MERLFRLALIFCFFLAAPLTAAHATRTANSVCAAANQAPLAVSLDGVDLQGCLPFTPNGSWFQPDPKERVQMAYTQGTGAGFSITAIPFGAIAPSEVFPPVDSSTSEASLSEMLRQFRQKQGAIFQAGPSAQLFGRTVESLVSIVSLPVPAASAQTTRVTEWLLIASQRLWVFRAVQPVALFGMASASGLTIIASSSLNTASTSLRAKGKDPIDQKPAVSLTPTPTASQLSAFSTNGTMAVSSVLPSPRWWNGVCDSGNYNRYFPYNPSYKLGPSLRNVPACGPLPGYYLNLTVYFYDGAFPIYEFQCVELVMRWMYLAYGVKPYAANGNGIVTNYTGSEMNKIFNKGDHGIVPLPGDVLSYGYYTAYGHTSVVIDSNVNSSGNGSITVMEENWTADGESTLPVSKWMVSGGNADPVYAWLHAKKYVWETPTPSPTPTCTPVPTQVITPFPTLSTPFPNQVYFPFIYSQPC